MNLQTYCLQNGGTAIRGCPVLERIAASAKKCSPETLYMIAKGHKRPGPKMAGRIEAATDGAVTRYELRPDVFGALPADELKRTA